MYWFLLIGYGLGGGCASEPVLPEPELESHPVSLGQEVVCAEPVSGFNRFTDEAAARGITPDVGLPASPGSLGPYAVGVSAVDGDADGDVDLFFSDLENGPQVFENDGSGFFARVDSQVEVPLSLRAYAPFAAFGLLDLTGDGLVDLLGFGHRTVLFAENLGGLRFGPTRPAYLEEAAEFGFTVSGAWADADGDGDVDLLLPGAMLMGENPSVDAL